MGYQEKYNKRKKTVLDFFFESFNKEIDILHSSDFIIHDYSFKNARNDDDFIEFNLKNNHQFLTVNFWIGFWHNYEINNNFLVTYILKDFNENIKKQKSIEFVSLVGNTIQEKMNSLIKLIYSEIHIVI